MSEPQLNGSELTESTPTDPEITAEAQRIAAAIQEPLLWLVENVVKILGPDRANHLLQQTLEIESAGGMATAAGDRRRTPGGVYLKLLKEQTTPEEQSQIFLGGPKQKPPDANAIRPGDPLPISPLPWDQARVEIVRLIKQLNESLHVGDPQRPSLLMNSERASVKITLVGRPTQVSKTKSCVVVAMKGSRPPSLPKGLPPAPDGSDFSYAVFISLRHWAKVAPIMAQDKNERLLVEGYPIFDPKRGVTVILAQSARTINLSRRESRPPSKSS